MLATMAATVMSSSSSENSGMSAVSMIISLIFSVAMLVAYFKLFTMAGEPAWAAIIPFYSSYVLFRIIYGNGWKFLLMLVPILGEILAVAMLIRLAQVYGRSTGFGIGLIFLSPIFFLLLAFDGKSNYQGPHEGFI